MRKEEAYKLLPANKFHHLCQSWQSHSDLHGLRHGCELFEQHYDVCHLIAYRSNSKGVGVCADTYMQTALKVLCLQMYQWDVVQTPTCKLH